MIDRRLSYIALVVAAAACGGSSTGPGGGSSTPHFLHSAASAPPLAQTSVTFWAYRDRASGTSLWYRPALGQPDSTELLRFDVPSQSIAQDSVQITVSVVDTTHMIVQFEPSGLTFSAQQPAHLTLWYTQASADLNGDGVVTSADSALAALLSIWKQERPGDPWVVVPSISTSLNQVVDADITGFTRYAIAY